MKLPSKPEWTNIRADLGIERIGLFPISCFGNRGPAFDCGSICGRWASGPATFSTIITSSEALTPPPRWTALALHRCPIAGLAWLWHHDHRDGTLAQPSAYAKAQRDCRNRRWGGHRLGFALVRVCLLLRSQKLAVSSVTQARHALNRFVPLSLLDAFFSGRCRVCEGSIAPVFTRRMVTLSVSALARVRPLSGVERSTRCVAVLI
jgi:hypothetical protein